MLGLLRQSTRAVVRGRTLCAAAEAPRSAGQQFSDLEHYTRGPRLALGMLALALAWGLACRERARIPECWLLVLQWPVLLELPALYIV